MANKGTSAGIAGIGVLFLWSGIRGASVTGSLRDLLTGKTPQPGVNPITGTASPGAGSGGTTSDLANDALRYRGVVPYKWGGSSPAGWDCSGALNYWLGHDLGLAIPGHPSGQYSGHGPVTGQYFVWSGAENIPQSEVQAGDLVCFLSHIGVAISSSQMISALNPSLGTAVTTFAAARPFGEPMRFRRLVLSTSPLNRTAS